MYHVSSGVRALVMMTEWIDEINSQWNAQKKSAAYAMNITTVLFYRIHTKKKMIFFWQKIL